MSKDIVLPALKHRHSPNFSSRHGSKVSLLVYHETAGHYPSDIDWLCNPESQASAHGVMREDGNELTQLVTLEDKAWHAVHFNPISVGIEHSNLTAKGFATEKQLEESARLFAWLCKTLKIPVRIASQSHPVGICRHLDLGSAGGGHTQCGMGDADFHRWLRLIAKEYDRGGFRKDYLEV